MIKQGQPTDASRMCSGKKCTKFRNLSVIGTTLNVFVILFFAVTASLTAQEKKYETIKIPADRIKTVVVDGNRILEHKLYDATAEGAGVTFVLRDSATIRNVGVKGSNQVPDKATLRMGGGTKDITIKRVYSELYDTDLRGPVGMIATKHSSGKLHIRGATIKGYGNNGLYASKSDMDILIEDSFFVNNRTTNIRLGGNYHGNNRSHVARNNVVWTDERVAHPDDGGTVALYPLGGDRVTGLNARHGSPEFHNNHVWFKWLPGEDAGYGSNWATVSADDRTTSEAHVYGGEISPRGNRLIGDVFLHGEVGTNPGDGAPDYAPISAEDAASGFEETNDSP